LTAVLRDIWLGLALVVCWCPGISIAQANPLFLEDVASQQFEGYLSALDDPSGTMDVESVRRADSTGRFLPLSSRNFNFGFPEGSVWLRFSLKNPTGASQDRWLELENSLLTSVVLYLVNDDGTVTSMSSGTRVPVEQRPLTSGRILFPVSLGAGQTTTAYLRISGPMAVGSVMVLWQPIAYAEAEWRRMAWKFLVIAGAVTIVVLVSIYYWQHNRRLAFLSIGVGDVLFGMATFMVDGVAAGWLPANDDQWQARAVGILILLALAFHMVFARVFLDLPKVAPRLAQWVTALTVVSLIMAAAQGFMVDLRWLTFHVVLLLSAAMCLLVALAAWRGIRNASLYLVNSCVLLSIFVLILGGAIVKAPIAVYASVLPLPSFLVASLVLAYAMYRDVLLAKEATERTQQNLIAFQRTERERLAMAVDARTRELRRAKAQAEDAGTARLAFLSTVSHELRTPLHTILGYAQLLRRRGGRREADAKLATIESSGLQLLHLIDGILEFIRGDSHPVALRPTAVVLGDMVRHLDDTGQVLALAGGNRFKVEPVGALPRSVEVDEQRLLQVLDNLISNGCKYTSNGQVTLRIEPEPGLVTGIVPPGAHRLRFSVEDTGIGIAEDQQSKLFEPFSRLAGNDYRPGIGLGLAIARQTVRAMGGDISLESEPARGSCFHFTLTLPEAAEDSEVPRVATPRIVGQQEPQRTLLVADDIPENRQFLEVLCSEWGFRVLVAGDGAEALAICRTADPRPECVLVDQFMPGMDGWALLRELRTDSTLAAMPAILVSAAEPQRSPQVPDDIDFDHVLLKPIRQDDLAQTLKRLLGLEWVLDDIENAASLPVGKNGVPSQAQLATLREMLSLGRVVAIRRWAQELVRDQPELAEFASEAGALAESVDLAGLERLLNRAQTGARGA
jgi:signal transduction histidine kinase/DNA-binding NarL/FixJ family response regulator